MGYSEVLCRICGVSFNIGRVRRPGDPRSEGWALTGDHGNGRGLVDHNYGDCDDDLCQVIRRAKNDQEDSIGDESRGKEETWIAASAVEMHYGDQRENTPYEYEHVAGPNCRNRNGYNGHLVTAQEMRGCNILQCLMRKNTSWVRQPDDLDFEVESECFLSGISEHMPSRDIDFPIMFPPRHGLDDTVNADDIIWDEPSEVGMPFHPTCLDIFMRVSRLRLGKVDINGLRAWFELEGDYDDVHKFPHDPNITASRDQSWMHLAGLEYLVANPLFVPRLQAVVDSAIVDGPALNPDTGTFIVPQFFSRHRDTVLEDSKDVLEMLPAELVLEITTYLGSNDIANIRLASRAFRQLPVSIWRRLLREDMPWLWELERNESPYSYATFDTAYMKRGSSVLEEIMIDTGTSLEALEERMLALRGDRNATAQFIMENLSHPLMEIYFTPLRGLVRDVRSAKINWYTLYTNITKSWADLKGLKNRRRIWEAVNEIITRIEGYRATGKLVN
ncbi:hypothetical protein PVAG01_09880 [Phlyctema vagabunda]|uniref:F-box domain-containing protein n=1 Tax=Phlyctema vagabunda TaxID=108571 RepID=A0ABR4P4C9_9HELO